jgi:hypothetical protein
MAHAHDAHAHHHDAPRIDASAVGLPERHPLVLAAWIAGGLGLLALLASMLRGWGDAPEETARFLGSYLTAWVYWLTIALGGLFFTVLHHLTRAGWSVVIRRLSEHVAATLPVLAALFVPIAVGAGSLFSWMGPGAAGDELVQHKAGYLDPTFFYVRSAIYLLVWSLLGWWYWKRSLAQDATGDPVVTRRLQTFSAPAMVLFAVTLSFASFDWVMSLDPHWYSTIFGVYVFAGSTVAILSVLSLLAIFTSSAGKAGHRGPLAGVVTPEHLHDLGKLLFGFVVFWAYIGFSQYMLIWYGNIPEETVWYAHRMEHGWDTATYALVIGHFALPFLYLLSRDVKRRRLPLAVAAIWMLAVHYLDLFWLVMPAASAGHAEPVHFAFAWYDFVNLLAVGGITFGAFGWVARRRPLVPVADPRLPESLTFENM